MLVLFRSFVYAAVVLAVAAFNCAFLVFLETPTSPTYTAIFTGYIILSVVLAAGAVLAAVFLQRIRNRREAAFRETCVATLRKPGDPMSPAFLETLHARERQLAGEKQKTLWKEKRSFGADVLVCVLFGFAVNAATAHFFPEKGEGLLGHALADLHILLGLLAVSLYWTYKMHLVNRIQSLKLLRTMIELRLTGVSDDEATRRKDLWVSRSLNRSLLQIMYE